jgi:hypothetical protein
MPGHFFKDGFIRRNPRWEQKGQKWQKRQKGGLFASFAIFALFASSTLFISEN